MESNSNCFMGLSQGLCDNLLSSVFRAWSFSRPVIVAPAMNTIMWESPFTAKHIKVLEDLGVVVLPTVEKLLACGDQGLGAMESPQNIAQACKNAIKGYSFEMKSSPENGQQH